MCMRLNSFRLPSAATQVIGTEIAKLLKKTSENALEYVQKVHFFQSYLNEGSAFEIYSHKSLH